MFYSYNAHKTLYDEHVRNLLADANQQQARQPRRRLLRPVYGLIALVGLLIPHALK